MQVGGAHRVTNSTQKRSSTMNMKKIVIEMEVPEDIDNSEVLAVMQEMALEWADEALDEDTDEDNDGYDPDAVTDAVSVMDVPVTAQP